LIKSKYIELAQATWLQYPKLTIGFLVLFYKKSTERFFCFDWLGTEFAQTMRSCRNCHVVSLLRMTHQRLLSFLKQK